MPNVFNEDVVSPATMQGAGQVADNLNQAARRAADAAMNRARISAEMKMQEQQLKKQEELANKRMELEQQSQLQRENFERAENEKSREVDRIRLDIEKQRVKADEEYRATMLDWEKKQFDAAQQREADLIQLQAEKARAGAAASGEYEKKLDEMEKEQLQSEKDLAAAQLHIQLTGNAKNFRAKKFQEVAAQNDGARTAVGGELANGFSQAWNKGNSEYMASKPGFISRFLDPFDQPYKDKSGFKVTEAAMMALGAKSEGTSDSSGSKWTPFFFRDEAGGSNPMMSELAAHDYAVDHLARTLSSATGKISTTEATSLIANVLGKSWAIKNITNPDSPARGGVDEKMLRESLNEDLAAIRTKVGPEAYQALVDSMTNMAFTKEARTQAAQTSEDLSDSDKAKLFKVLDDVEATGLILKSQVGQGPNKAMWWNTKTADLLPKLLKSYETRLPEEEYRRILEDVGVTPREVDEWAKEYSDLKTETEARSLMEEATRKQELVSRRMERAGERAKNDAVLGQAAAEERLAEKMMKRLKKE